MVTSAISLREITSGHLINWIPPVVGVVSAGVDGAAVGAVAGGVVATGAVGVVAGGVVGAGVVGAVAGGVVGGGVEGAVVGGVVTVGAVLGCVAVFGAVEEGTVISMPDSWQ